MTTKHGGKYSIPEQKKINEERVQKEAQAAARAARARKIVNGLNNTPSPIPNSLELLNQTLGGKICTRRRKNNNKSKKRATQRSKNKAKRRRKTFNRKTNKRRIK